MESQPDRDEPLAEIEDQDQYSRSKACLPDRVGGCGMS